MKCNSLHCIFIIRIDIFRIDYFYLSNFIYRFCIRHKKQCNVKSQTLLIRRIRRNVAYERTDVIYWLNIPNPITNFCFHCDARICSKRSKQQKPVHEHLSRMYYGYGLNMNIGIIFHHGSFVSTIEFLQKYRKK